MNKSLTALKSKLNSQLSEIRQSLEAKNDQKNSLQEKLNALEIQIKNAYVTSSLINPEQEMARLHFIIKTQQGYENTALEKKELESQESQLLERKSRLLKELKMLDLYQEKHRTIAESKQSIAEEREKDDWVLQRREIDAN